MQRIFAIALLVLMAALPALSQKPERKPGRTDGKVESEISQLEVRRLEAMQRVDAGFLSRVLADDLVYVHSSGRVQTKPELIEAVVSGELEYISTHLDDVKVRVYGSVAVATGVASMKVRSLGQQSSFRIRFTDVYVNNEGRWQMVAWQSTRLPETEKN